MTILGQITLHDRQFRIVDNTRMKTNRLCLEVCQNQFWHRVCRFSYMADVLFWLRLYEIGGVRMEDCREYQLSLKGRGKLLENRT